MIGKVEMNAISDTVEVKWTLPRFLPEYFKIITSCIQVRNHERTLEMLLFGDTNKHEHIINRRKSSIVLTGFETPSQCEIMFTSVYNPAQQDKGVTHMVHLPSASKCFGTILDFLYKYIVWQHYALDVAFFK